MKLLTLLQLLIWVTAAIAGVIVPEKKTRFRKLEHLKLSLWPHLQDLLEDQVHNSNDLEAWIVGLRRL